MIKIKLTDEGGYVVGDGDFPYDPDEFLIAFASRITAARMAGDRQVMFTDEEITAAMGDTAGRMREKLDNASVKVLKEGVSPERILQGVR